MTDAIANKLKSNIKYDYNLNSIEKTDDGYIIQTDESTFICQKIISTLPAYALSSYISDESLKKLLQDVEYVPVDVFHFGFNKSDVKDQSQGFGVLSKTSDKKHFLGILFNSRIFSHVSPQDKELFTVIVGGSRQKELCKLQSAELKPLVLEDLMELLKMNNEPIFSNHYKYPKGIPQYNLNHQSLLDAIQKFEKNNPNFHILGNYFNGISVSDSISKADNFIQTNF